MGLNQPAFFETLLASARIGAIFVPLNFRLTGPELTFIVGDAGVHTLVVDRQHAPIIEAVRAALPCRAYVGVEVAPPGWLAYEELISVSSAWGGAGRRGGL